MPPRYLWSVLHGRNLPFNFNTLSGSRWYLLLCLHNPSIDHSPQSPSEKGYDLDEMNVKGAFNHSSLKIVDVSELVEPAGWFPGRHYYVVMKGLSVGVFQNL